MWHTRICKTNCQTLLVEAARLRWRPVAVLAVRHPVPVRRVRVAHCNTQHAVWYTQRISMYITMYTVHGTCQSTCQSTMYIRQLPLAASIVPSGGASPVTCRATTIYKELISFYWFRIYNCTLSLSLSAGLEPACEADMWGYGCWQTLRAPTKLASSLKRRLSHRLVLATS